ncbi:MAG: hypothetical protein HY553_01145 [Elusimicrobia bacterium]|nr:hypothetical protein [Elusimicrobiota bacterium]
MRTRSLVTPLLCLMLLSASRASAQFGETTQDFAAFRVASTLLPHAFPTRRMAVGELTVKAVPAFVTFANKENLPLQQDLRARDQKASGVGAAVSVSYTLFENDWGYFGMGALGVYFKANGKRLTLGSAPAGLSPLSFYGGETLRGGLGAFTLNWDPFKSKEGFRMPMLVGLSYMSLDQFSVTDADLPAAYSPTGAAAHMRLNADVNLRSLGAVAGISPQFDAGKWLRFSPFAMISVPLKRTTDRGELRNTTTGALLPTHSQQTREVIPALGLELTYRPWDLGMLIVPPIPYMTRGAGAYTLKLAKTFGGR